MSGHSKWSTIKHKKGMLDKRRGDLFTKLSREIIVAAHSGEPDPEMNFRLRLAVDNAKSNNMPKEKISKAIERAKGTTTADQLFEVTYEVIGPGGAGIIVVALTNNKNRTVTAVRSTANKHAGAMTSGGSLSWNFIQQGKIVLKINEEVDPEEVALETVEYGAEDFEIDEKEHELEIYFSHDKFAEIRNSLLAAKLGEIIYADLELVPKNTIELSVPDSKKMTNLLDALSDLDDVQKFYTNAKIADAVLAD